jgi:predicted dehydrogenase
MGVTPLRAAVIGTGRVAVQHLGCLERLPGARVVAVCDLSRGRAEAAAARWGVPRWYVDHRQLLEEHAPDVVHVTTPPGSHAAIALDALAAGSHVIVEKPAALDPVEVDRLLDAASRAQRRLVESYTYVFSPQVQRLLGMASSGQLGDVVHVDASLALGILERGSPFADPHVRHPALDRPGGAVSDFLTHLASLAVAFAGPHRRVATVWQHSNCGPVPTSHEMRALLDGEDATAALSFSASARPEGFWLRVEATRARAVANLFGTRLGLERVRSCPRPLEAVANDLCESRDAAAAAVTGVVGKLSGGPGSYTGLWTIIERTYEALAAGAEAPVAPQDIRAVNRLVAELTQEAAQP